MKFFNFLEKQRIRLGAKNATEHYNLLGGQNTLQISVRQFQLISSDESKPSLDVLSRIFRLSDDSEKKDLFVSFFDTHVNDNDELIHWLKNDLRSYVKLPTKSKNEILEIKYLTDDQLKTLAETDGAFQLWEKVLRNKRFTLTTKKQTEIATILRDNGLIKISKDEAIADVFKYIFPRDLSPISKRYLEKIFSINIEMNLNIKEGLINNTIMHVVDVPHHIESYLVDELNRLNNLILAYSNLKNSKDKSDIFWVSIFKGSKSE